MHVITRSIVIDYLLVFALALVILVFLLLFVGASLDLPKDVGVSRDRADAPLFVARGGRATPCKRRPCSRLARCLGG